MKEYKDISGIIFHSFDYKENKTLVKVFTKELGLINLSFVKYKSVLASEYQPFSENIFTLGKSSKYYYAEDIEILNNHYNLRKDIYAYSFANLFVNVIECAILENMIDPISYDLFSKSLENLEIAKNNIYNIVNAFLLKFISFQGFKPLLLQDKNAKYTAFIINEGRTQSMIEYRGDTDNIYYLTVKELEYLNALLYNKLEILLEYKIDKMIQKKIFRLLVKYLEFVLEIEKFHSMNFIEKVCL